MLVNPRHSVDIYTVYHLEVVKMYDYSKKEDVIHSIQNELYHFCNNLFLILFSMNTM